MDTGICLAIRNVERIAEPVTNRLEIVKVHIDYL